MDVVSSTEAQKEFDMLLDKARNGAITISRQGRSIATMLSTEEYNRLKQLEAATDELRLKDSISDMLTGNTLPAEQVHKELAARIQK